MPFRIYRISNDVNDKLYIGITNQSLRARWLQHIGAAKRGSQKPLYVAMRELGIEHFQIEQLEMLDCERYQAESIENEYICSLGSAYPQGYNLRTPLTNEQVAIIRFNPYGWPRARLAQEFNISLEYVSLIRTQIKLKVKRRGKTKAWLIYSHVTREHLTSRPIEDITKLPVPEPAIKQEIPASDPEWITIVEAAAFLSAKYQIDLSPGYVRQVAHDGHIRMQGSADGLRTLLSRADCESYQVNVSRILKARQARDEREAAKARYREA